MKKNLIFTVDDVNYHGGAHVALYNQIDYLLSTGEYNISILSKTNPEKGLSERFPSVTFIKDEYSEEKVISVVGGYDCVCVPFENSVYRVAVSKCNSPHKIQWIHIDYFEWRKMNQYSLEVSQNDGELYQHFDRIVFVSKASRRGFLMMYPELAPKCFVCYNLMDTEKIFRLAEDKKEYKGFLKPDVIHIVTAARIDNIQKGIRRYIRVAKRLRDEGYDFEWVILGNGPDFEYVKTMVEDYGLTSYVRLMGHSSNPYVYMKNADLFALFSYYEGIPNTVFESLILGTPVAATAITGVKEQVSDSTGYLTANLEKDIFNGMKYILDHPSKIQEYKENLKQYQYDNDAIRHTLDVIFSSKEPCADQVDIPPLVSVIVTDSHAHGELKTCLDSFVNQSLEKIEVIVVHDGGAGTFGKTADDFCKRYPGKVISICHNAEDPGDARDLGLKHARGYFTFFADGEDYADILCCEKLLKKAISGNYDLVLCDEYEWDESVGRISLKKALDASEGVVDKRQCVMLSTRQVLSKVSGKLFKTELFQGISLDDRGCDDVTIMPVIYSYIQNIFYLPEPLYVRSFSRDTHLQMDADKEQILDFDRIKEKILSDCSEEFQDECYYAVYDYICRIRKEAPAYAEHCMHFINEKGNKAEFQNRAVIAEAIRDKKAPWLFGEGEIPKKIHYCWFDGKEKNEWIRNCINSWRLHLQEYEIIEWNEKNFDFGENSFADKAYKEKNWSILNEYCKFKILYEHGGVFLDTDMMVYQPFHPFLHNKLFFAFETDKEIHTGVLGAQAGEPAAQEILKTCFTDSAKAEVNPDICQRITDFLVNHGLETDGSFQVLEGDVAVYPPNVLTIDVCDGVCAAERLYDKPWRAEGVYGTKHKYELMDNYFAVRNDRKREITEENVCEEEDFYKREYERMLASKSWKITKPIRIGIALMKKVYRKLRRIR